MNEEYKNKLIEEVCENKKENKKQKNKSFVEDLLKKKSNMREKEFNIHKFESIKISLILGLFCWLIIGVLTKNILLGAGVAIIATLLIFLLLLQLPLAKRKKYARKIESELPLFLTKLASQIKLGKSFNQAILSAANEDSAVDNEFKLIVKDMNKGASFQEALELMNRKINSQHIKRACSNLSNLHNNGKKDVEGIKKLALELLLKQRIESKEFSGKMVVYALVFIAISAIIPAMFMSFTLIGSYFMKLSFTPQQIFLISIILFPLMDSCVLLLINSKTPLFLKG
jgi:archaeal flagellar protein FlaJ